MDMFRHPAKMFARLIFDYPGTRPKKGVNGSNQKPSTPDMDPDKPEDPRRNEYSNLRMGGPKTDVCVATCKAMPMPNRNFICSIF
jgi:hypothetical protein